VAGVLAVALAHFLVLWPFLLLAFIHPFYRARLETVWGLPQAQDPR
jgi:dolichol kinase